MVRPTTCEAKALARLHCKGLGWQLTILRPSVIFGAEDKFMNLFARLQAACPWCHCRAPM